MQNDAVELVFVPFPGMGHIRPAIDMAKLLIHTQQNLSVTLLAITFPNDSKVTSYLESFLSNNDSRMKVKLLPNDESALKNMNTMASAFFRSFIDSHKPLVRDCVQEIVGSSGSVRLAGFVVDAYSSAMADVAHEFGVPTYVLNASGAAMLGLQLHLQSLRDERGVDVTELKDSDPDLIVSAYLNPFPVKLLPFVAREKTGWSTFFLDVAKRMREAKGIIVNTFFDLEPHALESLSEDEKVPPVYLVGPLLNLNSENDQESEKEILEWLGHHPDSSVVFLCFGSAGFFPESQVKEIAYALERSGHRFLWTLRRPPTQGSFLPTDYNNPSEILPEGFLERTKSIGKVIGWAPQAAVLAHPAVGGFVSHCGWNSILESVWFGVPMATWPIYSEQQANAFQVVREMGIGVEIKMDYIIDIVDTTKIPEIVSADVIETGIRKLMIMDRHSNPARKKAEELKEQSRAALAEGGSSYSYLGRFFEQVMTNLGT
nr:UDP-glucose flavonoid 3-O-glucosyltransferase 6-like [Ipomoea batatas]